VVAIEAIRWSRAQPMSYPNFNALLRSPSSAPTTEMYVHRLLWMSDVQALAGQLFVGNVIAVSDRRRAAGISAVSSWVQKRATQIARTPTHFTQTGEGSPPR
jgi:hypothetical protein